MTISRNQRLSALTAMKNVRTPSTQAIIDRNIFGYKPQFSATPVNKPDINIMALWNSIPSQTECIVIPVNYSNNSYEYESYSTDKYSLPYLSMETQAIQSGVLLPQLTLIEIFARVLAHYMSFVGQKPTIEQVAQVIKANFATPYDLLYGVASYNKANPSYLLVRRLNNSSTCWKLVNKISQVDSLMDNLAG